MGIFGNDEQIEYTFKIKLLSYVKDEEKIPDLKGYLEYIIGKHFDIVELIQE